MFSRVNIYKIFLVPNIMSLEIYYDEEGDFLEISNGDISNCYFDNLGNGIFQIIDKNTKEVKGIAMHKKPLI